MRLFFEDIRVIVVYVYLFGKCVFLYVWVDTDIWTEKGIN